MNVQDIPLDLVEVGARLRVVNEATAALIADSMLNEGVRTPIEVRAQNESGYYTLVAGAHRLRAAALAGLEVIPAIILDLSDHEATLREIDENLMRRELSELERGAFLARRKQVYELSFPAARRGSNQWQVGFDKLSKAPRFTADAAERIGLNERAIQRSIHRFEALGPQVYELLQGTRWAEIGTELDAIARIPVGDRIAVVEHLVADGGSVAQARAKHAGAVSVVLTAEDRQIARLTAAWAAADEAVQDAWLKIAGLQRKKTRQP